MRLGNRIFPSVENSNKKDARTEAADVALRILMAEGSYQAIDSSQELQVSLELVPL